MFIFRRNLQQFSKLKTLLANDVIPKYKERTTLIYSRIECNQEGTRQQGHLRN